MIFDEEKKERKKERTRSMGETTLQRLIKRNKGSLMDISFIFFPLPPSIAGFSLPSLSSVAREERIRRRKETDATKLFVRDAVPKREEMANLWPTPGFDFLETLIPFPSPRIVSPSLFPDPIELDSQERSFPTAPLFPLASRISKLGRLFR